MSARRRRRRERRRPGQPSAKPSPDICGDELRDVDEVKRLTYTRRQAAEALGVSWRFFHQVLALGGDDIEPGFCWQHTGRICPQHARDWADAYGAVANVSYYNFGDCPGCPETFTGTEHFVIHAGGWELDDIYYVSFGALPAWPVPEIYERTGYMAAQWERLAEYGHNRWGASPMYFTGVLTQYGSCLQGNDCYVEETNQYFDNRPEQGFGQMRRALNSRDDKYTHLAPSYVRQRTRPYFSTDIRYDIP